MVDASFAGGNGEEESVVRSGHAGRPGESGIPREGRPGIESSGNALSLDRSSGALGVGCRRSQRSFRLGKVGEV